MDSTRPRPLLVRSCVLLLVLFTIAVAYFGYTKIPGEPGDWLLGLFFGHETVYSAGYTDSGWKRVELGMSQIDVRTLLGEPLEKARIGVPVTERWEYSTFGESTENYHMRFLDFVAGKVAAKCGDFTID